MDDRSVHGMDRFKPESGDMTIGVEGGERRLLSILQDYLITTKTKSNVGRCEVIVKFDPARTSKT
jgi:hypothetical protein